jgi:drug/metabolite transporter (DMT)-like permease
VESLNVKSKAGASKILGTLMSLGGVMLLSLYKGVPVSSSSSSTHHHTATPASASSHGDINEDSKSWMLGTVALLANCLCFSFWLLLQTRLTKMYPALCSSTAFISTVQIGALTVTTERHASVWIVTRKLGAVTILYSVRSTRRLHAFTFLLINIFNIYMALVRG